jgi:hypothetical protein
MLSGSSDRHDNYNDGDDTLESAHEKARTLGRVVVYPKPNELFVDIDCEAAMRRFVRVVAYMSGVTYAVRPSPSGRPGRYHVTVTMTGNVSPLERIALQAMLGSDPVREVLSWRRLQNGIETPTIFFEQTAASVVTSINAKRKTA